MPEPTKIPRPFADSGDKNSIPDSSGSIGFASWQEGFPAITSEPFAQGGVAPKRADFNGIFNALSAAIVWQQQGGFYAYDNVTDYEIGNAVIYNGDLYLCLIANGPGSAVKAPTQSAYWQKVVTVSSGTWTPVLKGANTAGTFTYTEQSGQYLKIGELVYYYGQISISAFSTHPVGNAMIAGLPFASSNTILQSGGSAAGFIMESMRKITGCYVDKNTTSALLFAHSSDSPALKSTANFNASNTTGYYIKLTSGQSFNLYFAGYYRAAS